MSHNTCTPKLRKRRHLTRLESPASIDHAGSLTDRLNTAGGRSLLGVNQILDELFPGHANLVDAQRLLSPPRLVTAVRCSNYQSYRTTANIHQRVCRPSLTVPLHSIQAVSPTKEMEATVIDSRPPGSYENALKDQRNHICGIWEDKFRRNKLSVGDSFYMVLHDDVMHVLENASLLREAQLTYAQAMEIEVMLNTMKLSQADSCRRSEFKHVPLCVMLATNVLNHGIAFNNQELRLPYCKGALALEKSLISRASLEPPKLSPSRVNFSAAVFMHRSPARLVKIRPSTISYGQLCRLKNQCGRIKPENLSPRIQLIEPEHSRGKHGDRPISKRSDSISTPSVVLLVCCYSV